MNARILILIIGIAILVISVSLSVIVGAVQGQCTVFVLGLLAIALLAGGIGAVASAFIVPESKLPKFSK